VEILTEERSEEGMVEEAIAQKPRLLQRLQVYSLRAWRGFVDLVTPPLCLSCQTPVTAGSALCLDCWQKLNFIDEPVCDMLGTPFAYDEGAGAVSPAAIADPPPWDKARAAVVFDKASKHLVHLLKYNDLPEAGLAMARMMAGAGRNLLEATDVIIPVPLHRRRLWQRRFNQAAFLARMIARSTAKPIFHNVLLRVEATSAQVGLDAAERRMNVRDAFAVALDQRPAIDGKTVLLIDDVRTTGATASACARALRKAGAAQIFVLSFALVLEPSRLHIEA
jgi:ComF family protein